VISIEMMTRRGFSNILAFAGGLCTTSSAQHHFGRTFGEVSSMTPLPKAVVIAGPSGVGKGTLIERLRNEFPALFGFSVSHTTRQPRVGEQDGVHYHFTTVPEIQRDIEAGLFIEHAQVHGKFYGTSVAAVGAVRDKGRICILDIDVQGCRLVRDKKLPAKFFFIAPPSMEVLEHRLRGRGTEDETAILKRLANAMGEIEAKDEPGLFDVVIVNDNLDKAFADIKEHLTEELKYASAWTSK
jgi:guanylate kinase